MEDPFRERTRSAAARQFEEQVADLLDTDAGRAFFFWLLEYCGAGHTPDGSPGSLALHQLATRLIHLAMGTRPLAAADFLVKLYEQA